MPAEALERLAAEARLCRICVDKPEGLPLPHDPRPVFVASARARILIAGQAPGTRVHASGIPFTDPSGDRLRDWLAVTPEEFYDPRLIAILPMGFCFPGLDASKSDLPPRRECAPAWRSRFMAAMPQVELVLTVGGYAHDWHLGAGNRKSVTDTVAAWRELFDAGARPNVLPLPHPSWRNSGWLKRNPWFERELLPVLRQRVRDLITAAGEK